MSDQDHRSNNNQADDKEQKKITPDNSTKVIIIKPSNETYEARFRPGCSSHMSSNKVDTPDRPKEENQKEGQEWEEKYYLKHNITVTYAIQCIGIQTLTHGSSLWFPPFGRKPMQQVYSVQDMHMIMKTLLCHKIRSKNS